MKFANDPMFKLQNLDEVIQETLKGDTPLTQFPTIKEFYTNREIFITGGSGFVGKVLIEKLLRSCPDIKVIYMLLRPKKDKTIEERLREIVEMPLFKVISALRPDFAQKLVPIAGDVSELRIGLSTESLDRMQNVSIIFHSAASVRFDDSLKKAVLMNTRGTREVMRWAETLKNIKLLMHVSTTFSNVYLQTVEEKIYPPAADWRKTIEICEKLGDDELDTLTQHYISFMPNTYVFSKNLAEQVTNEYKDKLPLVLFRPSVIIGSLKEPFQGWTDNLNGPMGILLASSVGISKTMYADSKNVVDMIPVDICCKAMIIAAWKRANETENSLTVYNCASGDISQNTIEQLLEIGISGVCRECPMEKMIWQAGGGVTLCKSFNLLRLMIYQVVPAIILDSGLKFLSKKPKLMRIQRKMYEANKALSYFVTNNWDFRTENLKDLCSFLRIEDIKDFEFRHDFFYDRILLLRYAVLGYRRYLLKESDDTLPMCRQRYLRIEQINIFIKSVPYLIICYLVFVKYEFINFGSYFT